MAEEVTESLFSLVALAQMSWPLWVSLGCFAVCGIGFLWSQRRD